MPDRDELERLAALAEGAWGTDWSYGIEYADPQLSGIYGVTSEGISGPVCSGACEEVAEFIAAANPESVLALIAALRVAQEATRTAEPLLNVVHRWRELARTGSVLDIEDALHSVRLVADRWFDSTSAAAVAARTTGDATPVRSACPDLAVEE